MKQSKDSPPKKKRTLVSVRFWFLIIFAGVIFILISFFPKYLGLKESYEKEGSALATLKEKMADIPMQTEIEVLLNQTIKKVTDDIEQLKMNTAVSTLMIFANHLAGLQKVVALLGHLRNKRLVAPCIRRNFSRHCRHI